MRNQDLLPASVILALGLCLTNICYLCQVAGAPRFWGYKDTVESLASGCYSLKIIMGKCLQKKKLSQGFMMRMIRVFLREKEVFCAEFSPDTAKMVSVASRGCVQTTCWGGSCTTAETERRQSERLETGAVHISLSPRCMKEMLIIRPGVTFFVIFTAAGNTPV